MTYVILQVAHRHYFHHPPSLLYVLCDCSIVINLVLVTSVNATALGIADRRIVCAHLGLVTTESSVWDVAYTCGELCHLVRSASVAATGRLAAVRCNRVFV
jgi:hypothetical protein